MARSTHIRRFTTLAVVAGALTVLVPVAQAEPIQSLNERATQQPTQSQTGYGVDRVSDSVEAAQAAQREQQFQSGYGVDRVADSVEASRAALLRDTTPMPDVVDRAVVAHQQELAQPSFPPDVLERTAAAGPAQYYFQSTESTGFDWSDFGIGAGAGVGLMLLLGGLGIGVAMSRRHHGEIASA